MPNGPVPLRVHAMIEPIVAIVFIVAPFVLGFDDSTAKTLSVVVGIVILVVGATTRWPWSVVKLIPLAMHFTGDLAIGGVAIAAPFVLGFRDDTVATIVLVVLGAGELGAALGTSWRADERRTRAAMQPTRSAPPSR